MRLESIPLPEGTGFVRFSFPRIDGESARAGNPADARAAPAGEPSAFLSLRSEGDMRHGRTEARARFFSSLGLDHDRVLGIDLGHTRRVRWESSAGPLFFGPLPIGATDDPHHGLRHDGIIINGESGWDAPVAASVTVADCMPIWLLDRASSSFGVLHSGWRGTGILATAVEALSSMGGSPETIAVILGPAIGACCYAVDEERACGFKAEFGEESVLTRGGRNYLDLRKANIGLARKLGIGALLSVESCTACDTRLGSFRREGGDAFTRMVALCSHPSLSGIDAAGSSQG